MPTKDSCPGELTVVNRFDRGIGWIVHPEETMRRVSLALESDGGLWIVDPVDAAGVDNLLAKYAEPEGVVVLLDRHKRDSETVATRYDVPVYIPKWMEGVSDEIDAPIERFGDRLAGYEVLRLVDNPIWQEAVLFDGEVLVVPEALGTVDLFCAPGETLGVHPMLRAFPPKQLRRYEPDRLLIGHGEGVSENVAPCIRRAIDGARRTAIPLYLKTVCELIRIR